MSVKLGGIEPDMKLLDKSRPCSCVSSLIDGGKVPIT